MGTEGAASVCPGVSDDGRAVLYTLIQCLSLYHVVDRIILRAVLYTLIQCLSLYGVVDSIILMSGETCDILLY